MASYSVRLPDLVDIKNALDSSRPGLPQISRDAIAQIIAAQGGAYMVARELLAAGGSDDSKKITPEMRDIFMKAAGLLHVAGHYTEAEALMKNVADNVKSGLRIGPQGREGVTDIPDVG